MRSFVAKNAPQDDDPRPHNPSCIPSRRASQPTAPVLLSPIMAAPIDHLLDQAAQARRENRPADARRDLVEAVAQARVSNAEPATLSRALKSLGQIERDLKHQDAALELYEEAAQIDRQLGDPLTIAHTIRHLGDIHQDSSRPAQAEPLYLEALAIYRADPQTKTLDLANAVRPLALLKESAGQHDEADVLWDEARGLYASLDIFPGVAESAGHMAMLARRREDPERARRLLAEASEAAQKSGDYNTVRKVNEIRTWISG
ncbi:MAG TPA: tetratricopeptide repeat protein [Candidatus Acidoferrales bacterium]